MTIPRIIFPLSLSLIASVAMGQQAGTAIGRTPGSAARIGFTVTRVDPKPSCATAPDVAGGEAAPVPEMLFTRSWGDLICVRHADGRTEEVHSAVPKGIPSADGSAIAHWNLQRHELYVYTVASHTDALVESLPGANLRDMAWSAKGHMLSYFPTSASPSGIRSYDADSGKWVLFGGSFVGVVAPPDAKHVVAVSAEGVKSFSLEDASGEIIAKLQYPWSAEYSRGGRFLGILGNTSVAEQNAPPAAAAQATAEDDDGPDCTGGSSALIIQNTKTKQLADVPFPKGFDTVLDFSFSPDENAIAVTFGVVGCDYPGERARVYLVSLPELKLTPISPEDRLSVKPVWTPDGKTIVYSDYTGSDSPLVSFELATHKITRLTNPGQFGPDTWLGWR
jgi:hypothetical protein